MMTVVGPIAGVMFDADLAVALRAAIVIALAIVIGASAAKHQCEQGKNCAHSVS
jgi:hypothetical protein